MTLLLIALVLSRVPGASASPAGTRVAARMKQMLSFVDRELGDGPYFVGEEFTAAGYHDDVSVHDDAAFPAVRSRAVPPISLPISKRIEARPAYRKAMALAGPKGESIMKAYLAPWSPQLLSILRIVTGFLFVPHGMQKWFGFPAPFPNPIQLWSLAGIAGVLELVGGDADDHRPRSRARLRSSCPA